MTRKYRRSTPSGWRILIVDDNAGMLASTRLLLEKDGHHVLTARNGVEALELLERQRFDLLIVDYFMPAMTGEELIRRIRARGDLLTQIILATGYSGDRPARTMLQDLEIQGYHDKGEGAQKLLLWVDSALNTRRNLILLEQQRRGLSRVLELAPALHAAASLEEVLDTLLLQIHLLLREPLEEPLSSSHLAAANPVSGAGRRFDPSVLICLADSPLRDTAPRVRAASGRFRPGRSRAGSDADVRDLIQKAMATRDVVCSDTSAALPLALGRAVLGAIFIEQVTGYGEQREVLSALASQAAIAIQQALQKQVATIDPLTGVHLESHTVQQLRHFIKRGQRRGDPLSILLIELEPAGATDFRTWEAVGDRARCAAADLLHATGRDTDLVGKAQLGAFMMILPDTPPAGAARAARRLIGRSASLQIRDAGIPVSIRLNVGIATLLTDPSQDGAWGQLEAEHLELATDALIERAWQGLRRARGTGRPCETPALRAAEFLSPEPA